MGGDGNSSDGGSGDEQEETQALIKKKSIYKRERSKQFNTKVRKDKENEILTKLSSGRCFRRSGNLSKRKQEFL